tara:strand:- start:11141 stop:11602 length:462 start_codon:yes stop_codon:yes gene_type:complete
MKCCKCSNVAEYKVALNGRTYFVCEDHIPTQGDSCEPITDLDMLRSNKHIANLQGKEYILFAGLLWLAHRNGLKSIETTIIEHDRETGFCLVKARVFGERGEYQAYGDADQITCGKKVAAAYIRMSETRAVARALRFYTGTGMTALEELPNER